MNKYEIEKEIEWDTTNVSEDFKAGLICGRQEGRTQMLEKVKDIIEKLENDFESRLDENNKPDIVNAQVNGVLLGLSFVKRELSKLEDDEVGK